MPAWFYKFTILTLVTALSILTWSMFSAPNVQAHKTIPAAVTELAVTVNSEQTSFTTEKLVLGLGCFWGAEKRFEALPGVMNVVSGYADGRGFAPTYQNIIKAKHRFNPDNYAEVIEITYNPQQISTQTLIKALDTFHPAEDYHQDYIAKNPNGYCPDHSTGVTFSGEAKRIEMLDNAALLEGKHIVVIDSPDCPYCDKFKAEVAATYAGSIPMHFRLAEQLTGLSISSPTWATPTLLFLENGTEVHGVQGFVNRTDFYKLVGAFKLGQSEAFDVAFNKGTDARFCKQYEAFKNVGEGTFIDTLSGAPLFDTDYQFNSGSGWLSFTQAVKDSVTYHEDLSYGMVRTEIRAAKSGIHLGHVFDDGPSGKPRYCINATVLEFKPRI